ncbi:MAG: hypothetical protein RDV48_02950 [Candidatus Eremiobacteraeota bacterium]|nr:hypothetical protein [Candidatus Eremiobacteraeota bacterium]
MIIPGNRTRARALATMGAVIATACIFLSLYLQALGAPALFAHGLFGLALVIFLVAAMAGRMGKAGALSVTSEGITIPAGLRPLLLKWQIIEKIDMFEHSGKRYLGFALSGTEGLRKAMQGLAALNHEETGYHFCFPPQLFEAPLEEIHGRLSALLSDSEARKGLSGGEGTLQSHPQEGNCHGGR